MSRSYQKFNLGIHIDWAKFDPCDTFRIHFSVVKRVTATREYYRDNMHEALMDCLKLST